MRLQQSGEGYYLSVPKELVEERGWKKGDIFHTAPTVNGIRYIHEEDKE